MKTEEFNDVLEEQIKRSTDVLVSKAKEYATDDRLHNFKVAADLHGCSVRQALAGMMAKHTVSVYDMCNSQESFPIELWNEKITDSINYLLLLRAVIEEEEEKKCSTTKRTVDKDVSTIQYVDNMPVLSTILFPTSVLAEEALDHLHGGILKNGKVRVSDLLYIAGICCTACRKETSFGWTELRGVQICNTGHGYYLDLPKPVYFG